MPKLNKDELTNFMADVFPQVAGDFAIEEVGKNHATVRMLIGEKHLRPGGTVSGPSMFGLADFAAYMAILAQIGPVALAVTTNCSIDFMRKPAAGVDLLAECRVLKLGKRLAVADALIFSEGMPECVARAGLTYAIPPRD